ncbi:discoidin domain-containing protein [Paenibacillus sp. J5C_2022]|uniref:discoidin domain-containing protein n=1 Tax=Paenibacillus sp. J5C2022 TaxID=2977129 RepID=UPI0021CE89C6|nr:discoidin domain-containing protein [Paenibacillus sp. J5C2022]MCU6709093.1 discoidin domain-containing protein [Paenibacillus sp. J5C2022]
MCKKTYRFIGVLLCMVLGMSGITGAALPASAEANIAVHLYDDFEDYAKTGAPPSGFEMTGNAAVKSSSGALRNEHTVPNGTSVSLRIEESVPDQPDAGLAKRFGADDLTGELIVDFEIKLLDRNGSRFIEMKDSGNKGITLASIGTDGMLKLGMSKVPLQLNQWHRLSFAMNVEGSAMTASLYVDGEKKLDSIALNNSNQAAGMNYIRVRAKRVSPADLQPDTEGNHNFTTLLDQMRVYEGSELKTMEELEELQRPESLMDFDNELGISIQDRLAGALAMMLNNPNAVMDNVRMVNAFNEQTEPHKVDGTVIVPLRRIGELFGIDVQISGKSARAKVNGQMNVVTKNHAVIGGVVHPTEHIAFIAGEVLVPLDMAASILQKQVYTDYKGRGLIVIGDDAQPFDDALDRADENIKPRDNEKFYIEEAVKQIVYDRPSGEQAMNRLIDYNAPHPRVLATSSDFDRIKAMLLQNEPTIGKWYEDIRKQGEKHLAMPLPTDDLPDGRRMIGSRQVGPLVINLGMLYHLSDDAVKKEQYKQRIWDEVYAVSQFPSWNEDNEFLNTAEFMEGVAIAYDWLYDAWTPAQRQLLEEAIVQKGLIKSLEAYNKNVWWIHTYPRANNWNAVSNGSTILALMAIGDVDKSIALPSKETVTMQQFGGKILDIAFNALEDFILLEFTPDGAWAEGPSYWKYTLEYIVRFISSMETALGTSYGYDQTPGLDKTAYFPTFLSGAVGSLNYGDASNNKVISAEELWIAKTYGDRLLASVHLDNKVKYRNAGSELEMLWYEPSFYMPGQMLELDRYFSGTEVATFRSKWDDPAATFLGLKAGNNVVSHGHYDLGSFVFEALGQQWAIDLGKDDYNLPGYSNYDKERLTYYRLNPEGHNTLVINPDGGAQQNIKAFSKIEKTESKPLGGFAIANLAEAYDGQVSEAKRGVMLASNRMRATIQDEVQFLSPSTAYWFMHTEAEIEIGEDGQSAVFSKGGEKLWVGLNSDARDESGEPVSARFAVMDAQPLPESPNPANQNANEGIRKLYVKLDGVKEMRLTVTMIPIVGAAEDMDTTIVPMPLGQWSIADGDLIVPVIQGAGIDGKAVEGFDERTFNYTIAYPLDYTDVPDLTFTYDQTRYQVQVVPADEVPGVTKLIVSSLQSPEIKSVYYFHYKLVPMNGEEERLAELPIAAVSASASQADKGNTEDKAIDGNFDTYWGAEGDQWIMFDLGEARTLNSVGIAFIRGNERSFKFDIETSMDGVSWYKSFSGQSSGETLALEKTYVRQHDARYVRITGHGNSINQWNSYAEVRLYQLQQ